MAAVTEIIDFLPVNTSIYPVERNEKLLLQTPNPQGRKYWRDYPLLQAVNLSLEFSPAQFAPPRDIFGGDFLRLEWQQMNFRQPFYHRNADVDEISYQVYGKRTLMTEFGSVELLPGDFSRIPVAVAHDNHGEEDVHILFYVHAPVTELGSVNRASEYLMPPYKGWEASNVNEVTTECLGARGCDIAVSLADELTILNRPLSNQPSTGQIITVLRANGLAQPQTEWVYQSVHVWIGVVKHTLSTQDIYHRHCRADSIQCQLQGRRTLITQRGILEVEPGDFLSIPRGCAYTSVTGEESKYISVLTDKETPMSSEGSKTASPTTIQRVIAIRQQLERIQS